MEASTREPERPFLRPTLIERAFSQIYGALVGVGIGLPHNYVLIVRGRKSGREYSTPIDVLEWSGRRFLVAGRGYTQWVRNAEVVGEVELRKGRRNERCRLRTVAGDEKLDVLKAYLDRFRPTVQRYFSIPAGSPREAFAEIADRHPAFELLPKTKG